MPRVKCARRWLAAGLAACALFAACAAQGQTRKGNGAPPAQAQAPAAPGPPTLLRFDWGRELDADVFAIREEFTFKGNSERISRLEAQFHLHAQRLGDRYLLVFSELKMKIDDRPIPENAQPAMFGPIMGLVLNYEVAANGDFLGLSDFERLQSFSERSYLDQNEKLPPEKRATRQEAEQAIKASSSREVLQLEPSRTWGALVGMWAGITLTEGKPLLSDSTVTIPVINAPLTVHSIFELVRREECASGERKKACVRLRATSRPDPIQVADASRKLKESRGGAAETLGANGLQVEDRYELLTEPETLRPRWAEWVRGADIESADQGSELLQSRQSTRTRMIFVYK
jgi:hypothetical protein